ncbi:MAG: mannanase [Bacteroidetes bacterium]|jgi:mannan endo-1,4-beta-mannosidase|nr:mannanase [Bacteroidota bacterium]
MKNTHPVVLAVAALILGGCSGLGLFDMNAHFVRVQGNRFTIDGTPYYFAGTNMWYGCYIGSTGPTGNRERLCRELDFLAAQGITNLRVLAASESSHVRHAAEPPIQPAPGVVDEDLLRGLDFLLAEMADRDMRAVLYLNNFWEWSGGMAAYVAWMNKDGGVDPADTSRPWSDFVEYAATFYAHERANAYYRDYIRQLITRRNTVHGRLYSEDPTIMAWQLSNEPRPGMPGPNGEQNLPGFLLWIDSTAAFIHALDTNHLVSSGSEGTVGSLQSEDNYLRAHQSAQIDYLTAHVWPYNWRWFDPVRPAETLPVAVDSSRTYILKHIDLAWQLGKPIVFEEFGLSRDSGNVQPGSPTVARDRYFEFFTDMLYDSARAGTPIAGSNFWAWGGEARGVHNDSLWKPGDQLLGDPPHEPQGFNAIYDVDTSTVAILRRHAEKMNQLGHEPPILVASSRPRGR